MRARATGPTTVALWIAAIALGGAGWSCSYSPDFANDKLTCDTAGACPKGYACAADNKCWKTGETPGGSGGSGSGGSGVDASNDVSPNDPRLGFVGTWTFTGGTVDATCTDGSAKHAALTGDFIAIDLGAISMNVRAFYYCQTGWTLKLSAGNTMAASATGQMCVDRTTDTSTPPVTTTYTWSAAEFSFTLTGAQTGTSTGHFTGPFSATDGTIGTCDVMFTGPLTKH